MPCLSVPRGRAFPGPSVGGELAGPRPRPLAPARPRARPPRRGAGGAEPDWDPEFEQLAKEMGFDLDRLGNDFVGSASDGGPPPGGATRTRTTAGGPGAAGPGPPPPPPPRPPMSTEWVAAGEGRNGRMRPRPKAAPGPDVRAHARLGLREALRGTSQLVEFSRRARCGGCAGTGAARLAACAVCGGSGRTTVYLQREGPGGGAGAGGVRGRRAESAGRREKGRAACPGCGGDGAYIADACGPCGGTGLAEEHVSARVVIPAGVRDGEWVSVAGLGHDGAGGGEPGDLFVRCEVVEPEGVRRAGDDLESRLDVPLWSALLGCAARVETLRGWVDLEVPPCTGHGDRLVVPGAGAAGRGEARGRAGDHVFVVRLVVPRDLSDAELELVRALRGRPLGAAIEGL